MTVLTDGVLTLRPPAEADVEALYVAAQDPEIPRWTSVPSPYTREHAREFVGRSDPRVRSFLGFVDDELAGSFSLLELDLEAGYGEIGYWVSAPARGRGVASRAVTLLRDYGVRELGLNRIELIIHTGNQASLRVGERTGFLDTGERRSAPRVDPPTPPEFAVYAWSPE